MSPRNCLFGDDSVADMLRSRRQIEAGATSPSAAYRNLSPTFQTSTDFCFDAPSSAPEAGLNVVLATADKGAPTPFSARRMRQQSGRMTENSENYWAHTENTTQQPTVITNSEDGAVSRGKKTDFKKECESVKGRLQLDASQQDLDAPKTQRRHHFADGAPPPAQPQKQSTISNSRSEQTFDRQAAVAGVGRLQRTSAEMAATIMPDNLAPTGPPKYMVGDTIVDWQSCGRRGIAACARQAAQQGVIKVTAVQSTTPMPRDMRRSDSMYEQFQAPATLRSAVPVFYASSPVSQLASCLSQSTSIMNSGTMKGGAFMTGGLTVVNYSPKGIGVCSPNSTRPPAKIVSL